MPHRIPHSSPDHSGYPHTHRRTCSGGAQDCAAPPAQTCPAPQVTPQPPQFPGSTSLSTQCLQSTVPLPHDSCRCRRCRAPPPRRCSRRPAVGLVRLGVHALPAAVGGARAAFGPAGPAAAEFTGAADAPARAAVPRIGVQRHAAPLAVRAPAGDCSGSSLRRDEPRRRRRPCTRRSSRGPRCRRSRRYRPRWCPRNLRCSRPDRSTPPGRTRRRSRRSCRDPRRCPRRRRCSSRCPRRKTTQAPPTQVSPALQASPRPRSARDRGRSRRSSRRILWSLAALQRAAPASQTSPAPHCTLQPPQCAGSDAVFTHASPQNTVPPEHLKLHTPA